MADDLKKEGARSESLHNDLSNHSESGSFNPPSNLFAQGSPSLKGSKSSLETDEPFPNPILDVTSAAVDATKKYVGSLAEAQPIVGSVLNVAKSFLDSAGAFASRSFTQAEAVTSILGSQAGDKIQEVAQDLQQNVHRAMSAVGSQSAKTLDTAVDTLKRNLPPTKQEFEGKVLAPDGANVRLGAGREFDVVTGKSFGTTIKFDAWKRGEYVNLTDLKRDSDIWYRVAGTQNRWISATVIDGKPLTLEVTVPQAGNLTDTFERTVISTIGARVRADASTLSQKLGIKGLGEKVKFDAWKQGETVDLTASVGKKSDIWYRVAGTQNQWVSATVLSGDPSIQPSGTSSHLESQPTLDIPLNEYSDYYTKGVLNPFAYSLSGQCTWLAYGRMQETGLLPEGAIAKGLFRSDAADWQYNAMQLGFEVTSKPTPGARGLVIWDPGVRGADGQNGHVAFLEEVYPDGSIRISESNWGGKGASERELLSEKYKGLKFVALEKPTAEDSAVNKVSDKSVLDELNSYADNLSTYPEKIKRGLGDFFGGLEKSAQLRDQAQELGLLQVLGSQDKLVLINNDLDMLHQESYKIPKVPETDFTNNKLFDAATNLEERFGSRQDVSFRDYLDLKLKVKAQSDAEREVVTKFLSSQDLETYLDSLAKDTTSGGADVAAKIRKKIEDYTNDVNTLNQKYEKASDMSTGGILDKLNPLNETFSKRFSYAVQETWNSYDELGWGATKNGFNLATKFIPALAETSDVVESIKDGTHAPDITLSDLGVSVREYNLILSLADPLKEFQEGLTDRNFSKMAKASIEIGKDVIDFYGDAGPIAEKSSEIGTIYSNISSLIDIAKISEDPGTSAVLDDLDKSYLAVAQLSLIAESLSSISNIVRIEAENEGLSEMKSGKLEQLLEKADSIRELVTDAFDFSYKEQANQTYDNERAKFKANQSLMLKLADTVEFSAQEIGKYQLKTQPNVTAP